MPTRHTQAKTAEDSRFNLRSSVGGLTIPWTARIEFDFEAACRKVYKTSNGNGTDN
jgi:hypothetical protein